MNVEIGAEAVQFPEKEYINGIAIAVCTVLSYFVYSQYILPRNVYVQFSLITITIIIAHILYFPETFTYLYSSLLLRL
jgi:hypothetical protein